MKLWKVSVTCFIAIAIYSFLGYATAVDVTAVDVEESRAIGYMTFVCDRGVEYEVNTIINKWVADNQVEVFNVETLIIPNAHNDSNKASYDVSDGGGRIIGGHATWSQFVRVWYYE